LFFQSSKPKTKRGKRFLQSREPKVIENVKQAMFIKGGRTSEIVTKSLKQFVIWNFIFFLLCGINHLKVILFLSICWKNRSRWCSQSIQFVFYFNL